MKTKILYFKFTKKNLESHERNCKSKKNYANIFNNILNGEKNDKISEIKTKKNKIKCISKISSLNYHGGVNSTIDKDKKENTNNADYKNVNLSNNISNEKKRIEENVKEDKNSDKKDIINPINEYINKSKIEKSKNLKIDLTKPFNLNKNLTEIYSSDNNSKKNNKNKNILTDCQTSVKNVKKISQKKTSVQQYKKKSNINIKFSNKKKQSELKIKNEKKKNRNNIKIDINNNKYQLSQNENNMKTKKRISIKDKDKDKDNKYTKIGNNKSVKKRLSSCQTKNIVFKNTKKNQFNNYLNKITITNDNINENSKFKKKKNSFNYSLNNKNKSKKLIVNNTNRNINININITNINDKNINKKVTDFDRISKKSNLNSENNNYNNNITTVNIINNNSNSKKKLNDYRLLFCNHSKKEKYSSYLNTINSKGIEIQSININLGEESNSELDKCKLKKNLTNTYSDSLNNNHIKKKENEHEKKEVQSEYEHFRDLEDFWSNKSQTSFSCKSGFTASRKLRSLSRERDKIKLLNNCHKKNEQDIERIEDKLLKIVNNFHNNSGIYNLKKNRKSINGIRKKYKYNKNYEAFSVIEEKIKKPRKKKYLK